MENPSPDTETPITFSDLGLPEPLLRALGAIGYENPSPIQAACIPLLLEGKDMLGQAQTGTGKTAAFALPLLARIDPRLNKPQVLVLTPTRELAIQVAEAFQKYAHHMPGFQILPIYGGQSLGMQLKQLSRGPQVIVGTPGRVIDHLERESLNTDALSMVVLDEADEMLRMGFIDAVDQILEALPRERQVALFSATMPEPIRRVAHRHLRDPQEVKIASSTATVPQISQRYWQVSGTHKLDALTRILEAEEDLDAAIIFVRTKTSTVELADKLAARGYSAAALNGDLQQSLRERTVEQLRAGNIDLIIATDVAARGIDVARVSHVINYDIPYDTEAYVHRIGRTGRAGRKGCAILFVAPRERRMLKLIERATRQPIAPMALPTKADLANRRVARFKQQVLDVVEAEELGFFESLIGQMESELELDAGRIAAALAWMATKERPLRVEGSDSEESARPAREARIDREFSAPPRAGFEARPRGDFESAPRAPAPRPGSSAGLVRYKVNVGREQGITPRDLVGAIANEGNIESRFIGRIDLFDDFSTVELPADLSADKLDALRRVRVRQIPLGLSPDDGTLPTREKPAFRDGGNKFGGPRREGGGFRKEGGFRREGDFKPRREGAGSDAPRGPRPSSWSDRKPAGNSWSDRKPAGGGDSRPARREGPSSDRPQRRSEGGWSPAPGPRNDGSAPFKGKKFRKD